LAWSLLGSQEALLSSMRALSVLLLLWSWLLSLHVGVSLGNATVDEEAIFDIIDAGTLADLKVLIDDDATHGHKLINHQNAAGHTLLHWACNKGREEMADFLLLRGADISLSNHAFNGFSALHWATSNGFESIVSLLLDHGASVDAKDFNGRTALHLACERGHRATALLLIERGSAVNAESNDRKTPLHYAAFSALLPVVQVLLERGVDVNVRTKWEDTPLHYASSGQTLGHVKIIQLLLEQGADVDAHGMQGDTPFHWSCWKGLGAIAELLVRRGADMHWLGFQTDDSTPFSLGACETEPLHSKLLAAYDAFSEELERDRLEACANGDQAACDAGQAEEAGEEPREHSEYAEQPEASEHSAREEL